jgi:glyoxylase-like metal-dependent hydrolase (beta-lactamase superfamily II)
MDRVKLAPNLHRIGSDLVNSYLVDEDGALILIDAGVPGQLRDLEAELDGMGRSLTDIRGIVLTHGDTDHIGFAERLRRDHGIAVHIHEADAPLARGEQKKQVATGPWRIGPFLRFLAYAGRRGGLRPTSLAEVVPFRDGDTLPLPGSPRVIGLPGHTPGSVAIHVPHADALFVGDAMTTGHVLTGAIGPRPAPFTMDVEAADAALARLEGIEATWVLPGHGAPWNGGVSEALRRYREAVAAER